MGECFLLPWIALFVAQPALRRPMLWSGALTAPLGLSEFFFVPAYWHPPSLFDLAHRTGFDIESLIFCFAIGGLAAAGYRAMAPVSEHELAPQARDSHLHRWHRLALAKPVRRIWWVADAAMEPDLPGYCGAVCGSIGKWNNNFPLRRNNVKTGIKTQ